MKTIEQRVAESKEITAFQRKVYLALLQVPEGETITYGELARHINPVVFRVCGLPAVHESRKRVRYACG